MAEADKQKQVALFGVLNAGDVGSMRLILTASPELMQATDAEVRRCLQLALESHFLISSGAQPNSCICAHWRVAAGTVPG